MKKQSILRPAFALLTAVLSLFSSENLVAQTISTYAGGTIGEGKLASQVGISQASAMATDTFGNLYLFVNDRIRKVDKVTGTITTVAGGGQIADIDQIPLLAADVMNTRSIAIDIDNNIYIAGPITIYQIDYNTNQLKRVAGEGFGFAGDGAAAIHASFEDISSITTDNDGNLYISDLFRIRKISKATGIITTIAGGASNVDGGDDGPAVDASFTLIKSISANYKKDIAVLTESKKVRLIDGSTGLITTIAGTGVAGFSGDGGLAVNARLWSPNQIAFDPHGDLFITDYSRLRKVTVSTGIINTVSGSAFAESAGDGGPSTAATYTLAGMVTAGREGNLYIEDIYNSSVRKIDKSTNIITRWVGSGTGSVSGIGGLRDSIQLNSPENITTDNLNNLYIADPARGSIYKIDAATNLVSVVAGTGVLVGHTDEDLPAVSARIGMPTGLAVDTAYNIYFVEDNRFVRKVTAATGLLSTIAGTELAGFSGDDGPADTAALNMVEDIAVDSKGNILIADQNNHRIRRINAVTGIISTIAGTGGDGFNITDSIAAEAVLSFPSRIIVDAHDNIYFSENGNLIIRKIEAATGKISTIAGNFEITTDGDDSIATKAGIGAVTGIAVDSVGNFYLTAQELSIVRRIDKATGIIKRFAGGYGTNSFSGDGGPALNASLNTPTDLVFNTAGQLLIADSDNDRIRMVDFTPVIVANTQVVGGVFYDLNSDGIKGSGEAFADGVTVSILQHGTDLRGLVRNGEFKIQPDTGYYEIRILGQDNYTVFPNVFTGYYSQGAAGDTVLFGLRPIANQHDLSLNLVPLTPVRSGKTTKYRIEYRNSGTMVANNTKLKFIKSGKLNITSASPAFSSISGDTLTWNINTLNPTAFGAIEVEGIISLPPIANPADSMYSQAMITQADSDVNPGNDTVRLRQIIKSSYDPNDKIETHGGYLTRAQVIEGEYLNYIIRFQNTGNDTAFQVIITDTLESNLDPASFQMTGASHDYTLSMTDNKLTWHFDNILLPDSGVNEKASHGYLTFRIRPQGFVTNGTLISNRSDIFFDLNPPVRTNLVQTLIRDLPSAPPKPSIAIDSAYCGAILQQQIRVNNPGTHFKAKVIVGTVAVPIGADSVFNISPKLIPAGSYTIIVQYINESGESWLAAPVKITSPVTPEVLVASGTTTISSLAEVAMLTASNKKAGGSQPRFTFARDRNFTDILQTESVTPTYALTADKLANGSNWIYIRMKTSETCVTTAFASDSIKITKSLMTTSVTDVDNPGVTITGYPNPFSTNFTIKGLLAHKTYIVAIYDARGVMVSSSKLSNKTIHSINTMSLGTGTYWLSIRDAKKNKLIGTLKAIRN